MLTKTRCTANPSSCRRTSPISAESTWAAAPMRATHCAWSRQSPIPWRSMRSGSWSCSSRHPTSRCSRRSASLDIATSVRLSDSSGSPSTTIRTAKRSPPARAGPTDAPSNSPTETRIDAPVFSRSKFPAPRRQIHTVGWTDIDCRRHRDRRGCRPDDESHPCKVSKQSPMTQSGSLSTMCARYARMQMAGDPTADAFAAQEELGGQCRCGSQAGTQMSGAVPMLKKSARHSSPDGHRAPPEVHVGCTH